MTEFKKGQRVRVSYETTMVEPLARPRALVVVHPVHPGTAMVPVDSVELIDDPASDPIGTVRRCSAGFVWVKRDDNHWACIGGDEDVEDSEVLGDEVIGVVPGTQQTSEQDISTAVLTATWTNEGTGTNETGD